MTPSSADLHIFFLPLLAPGHMIPMVDLAILLSERVARSTIVTTHANIELIRSSIAAAESSNIRVVTVTTTADEAALPENLTARPTPDVTPDYFASLCRLEPHLERLLHAHRPDCIISDIFFPWTANLAQRHRIPRIAFHGTNYFCSIVMPAISNSRIHESVSGDEEPFVVPGIPHTIKMTRSQLTGIITSPEDFMTEVIASMKGTMGTVMNTFYEIEAEYIEAYKAGGHPSWHVGPVFLRRRSTRLLRDRGGAGTASSKVLRWLDEMKAGSVLYVCFGSLPRFTAAQYREIKEGLEAAGWPFVWVIRDEPAANSVSITSGEDGRFVLKGWAPQLEILTHDAVGGFMTHCGWNSCLEGIASGRPMVTWPLFADQPFNEKLLVDVLDLGVSVGSMVNSSKEEERTVVTAERIAAAVKAVMGGGMEAEERRQRAKKMKESAFAAVDEGGSSEVELSRMVEEVVSFKIAKMKEEEKNTMSTSQ